MIQKLLSNIQMLFDDIYKNTENYNPNKKRKYWFYLIWLLISLVIKNLIQ